MAFTIILGDVADSIGLWCDIMYTTSYLWDIKEMIIAGEEKMR